MAASLSYEKAGLSCLNLWCLHGNLGGPDDWLSFIEALRLSTGWEELSTVEVGLSRGHAQHKDSGTAALFVNLWDDEALSANDSPGDWALRFNAFVRKQGGRNILLGYSLGGRLAMEALAADPSLWQAGVLISSHPGGLSAAEKTQRKQSDEVWASLLEPPQFSWEAFLLRWDAQPVFASNKRGGAGPSQDRSRLIPSKISAAFRAWSHAAMRVSLLDVMATTIPLLWVGGSDDRAMIGHQQRLAPQLAAHVRTKVVDSGHRTLLEAPEALANTVAEFLSASRT